MTPTDSDTWRRLLFWDHGPTKSERFAADVLEIEEYSAIDPSHPLGGSDGLKDVVLRKDGLSWIAAVYFPNGQKTFATIRKKFASDFKGVVANRAEAFAFITNQELRLGERETLVRITNGVPCEIYHLERLRGILDGFSGVRTRALYLGIPATPADLLAGVGKLQHFISAAIMQGASTPMIEDGRRSLDMSPEQVYSYADLARLALEQGKSELHRAYSIDAQLLPAFANPEHPVFPIMLLDGFPAEIADCYRLAHETAMVLFFLQRSVGMAYMESLNADDRQQITRVVERLWRCTIRLRPLVQKCQATFIMVGANKAISPCAHLTVYMSASHFLQEILQASELIGYTTVSASLGKDSSDDPLPFKPEQLTAKWRDVVGSLRANSTIQEGFRLLYDAFYDLAGEAVRAVRYENGLPIVPAWMIISRRQTES